MVILLFVFDYAARVVSRGIKISASYISSKNFVGSYADVSMWRYVSNFSNHLLSQVIWNVKERPRLAELI